MKLIVTIARRYGSGGKEIGRVLAAAMGVKYYGREILEMLRGEDAYDIDDESIATVEDAEEMFRQQTALIHRIAEKESCVIVGRCADYVLRDMENVIRVYLHAPQRDCVKRVARLYELNVDDAKSLIHTMNKTRGDYYEHNTGKKWSDPLNYDICLNTSGLDAKQCAQIIMQYITSLYPSVSVSGICS